MNRTIRTQLLIVNTVALAIIFFTMSVYLVATNTATLRSTLKNEVQAFATLATAPIGDAYGVYGESGTNKVRETMRGYLNENESVVNTTVVNLEGKKLLSYLPEDSLNITTEQASTFKPIFETNSGSLTHVIYPYFGASGAHSYTVVYTVSNDNINEAVQKETISLLLFSVLSLIATSAVTYAAISYIILRPIRRVSQQAAIISGGNLEQQISVEGNNEIASLGRAVNAMADSLKASIAKLQEIDKVKSEFMAITSHNLRSPLTIINGYLESIDKLNTVEDLKKAISRIAASASRLGDFAEDVLTISRFELGEENNIRDEVNVREILEKLAVEAEGTAHIKELKFTANINTEAIVSISKPHLRNAISNLMDNALKFTKKGGSVVLKASSDSHIVRISIIDTGIGIKSDEISKLFTKFHRGTSVTVYDYEGTGIGLYAAKIIIEEAGGTIDVKSEEGKGSTFTINLPVATKASNVHT